MRRLSVSGKWGTWLDAAAGLVNICWTLTACDVFHNLQGRFYCPHFKEKKTEAQGSKETALEHRAVSGKARTEAGLSGCEVTLGALTSPTVPRRSAAARLGPRVLHIATASWSQHLC